MRLGLAALLLACNPAHAECTHYDWPTLEAVAVQAARCVNGSVPLDVTYAIQVQPGTLFAVNVAGKPVVVSTGPATCNGKPVAPVETDAHTRLDLIVLRAARCATEPDLDLDHPIVHAQLAHWKQTGPTASTLVRETRITVDFDTKRRKPARSRVVVDISRPTWPCTIVPRT
jgi:hypothetical protein